MSNQSEDDSPAASNGNAAPAIPNLLEKLRASRPARTGGKGRTRAAAAEVDGPAQAQAKDQVIQQTDNDAAVSRLSAVELGYLDDPFAQAFSQNAEFVRRMPVINRGTYVRTSALDMLIDRFLAAPSPSPSPSPSPAQPTPKPKQIVSLGAGTDTRFFRLAHHDLTYHELDFPSTTSAKIRTIQRTPALLAHLAAPVTITADGASLSTPTYHIHGVDLRALSATTTATTTTTPLPSLDPSAATLLLAECCLTYLDPDTSTALLSYFTHTLFPDAGTPLAIALYEPIAPTDPFGRTMLANLAARHIALPGMTAFPSIRAHLDRLRAVGFEGGQAGADTAQVWDGWVSEAEKARLRGLEALDEEEEWRLLAGHYAVVWAWRGGAALA